MNYKFKKYNIVAELTVGIGISYGKGLVVKTGYKGSSVSEVVWMGCYRGSGKTCKLWKQRRQ